MPSTFVAASMMTAMQSTKNKTSRGPAGRRIARNAPDDSRRYHPGVSVRRYVRNLRPRHNDSAKPLLLRTPRSGQAAAGQT